MIRAHALCCKDSIQREDNVPNDMLGRISTHSWRWFKLCAKLQGLNTHESKPWKKRSTQRFTGKDTDTLLRSDTMIRTRALCRRDCDNSTHRNQFHEENVPRDEYWLAVLKMIEWEDTHKECEELIQIQNRHFGGFVKISEYKTVWSYNSHALDHRWTWPIADIIR